MDKKHSAPQSDVWTDPGYGSRFTVPMPTSDDKDSNTPQHKNWAYVHGIVKFYDDYSEAARQAAEAAGLDDMEATRISNLLTRKQFPTDANLAVGTMTGKYPQIWRSNVDRNQVWQSVVQAYNGNTQ